MKTSPSPSEPFALLPGIRVEGPYRRAGITPAATDVVACLGDLPAGPRLVPVPIESPAELETRFGRRADRTTTGRAIAAALDNGAYRVLAVNTRGADVGRALESLPDDVALLVVPQTARGDANAAKTTIVTAQQWAEQSGVFFIADPPYFRTPRSIVQWLDGNPTLRSHNSAMYWPRLAGRPGQPPAGGVAGLFARTDRDAGVWKAAAGVEAGIRGATGTTHSISESGNDLLATHGINPLRRVGSAVLVWGGRTVAADSEWKYIPVRRTYLFLERSIERSTRWAVFEPNGESLWATVRKAVTGFLTELWREGAFTGRSQRDAFFVRCGRDTMTRNEIEAGRLIIEVGFAPLKPAEFVIFRIGQWTAEARGRPGAELDRLLGDARNVNKGNGLVVAFGGSAGNSRIGTARGLAAQLGCELYPVDLSVVVSRFIGETEKNLAALLDAAARTGGILFFDEADALFGRRSRARSGGDRYTSRETAYLLDRLEAHPGIAILAVGSPTASGSLPRVDFDQ